jgi:transcriptional regulator with XRE-family HTH domain
VKLNREALIAIRERSGMNKSQLADAAGVDRTLVHRIENGERNCTPDVLRKLAIGLKVPTTALLGPVDCDDTIEKGDAA